ncbi:MAG: efflux RND transporter periplasmic adaptor subunit [Candidatus Eremiobacteraeota bacterium]|nr:efflux RND transporter periplasmic adaptor subunit [Candidatus Eremiobacteraeota bacterium]
MLAIAVVVAIAIAVWLSRRGSEGPDETAHTAPIPVTVVHEGSVERTLSLTGRVGASAGTQVKLAFALAGTVAGVDVRLGERVDAGTPLARLDATGYQLAAQEAGADASAAASSAAAAAVDRTSVRLRVDRAELARRQRLYDAGVIALRDVQAAQAALAADDADARSARDQLSAARAQSASASAHAGAANYDLSRTTLRAPSPGVVTAIYVQTGDAVDATTPAVALTPAIARLATLDVPVESVALVSAGDVVHAHAGGVAFDARVAGVAPAVDPATGLAIVDVSGVPAGVAAGTPLDATVAIGVSRGLVVPRSAVIEDPQTGQSLVFVRKKDSGGAITFSARKVTVGAQADADAVVTSGLHAGEEVASQGAIDLLAPAGGD